MMKISVVVTCEHAGNKVPEKYKRLFRDADKVLQSHRGWDPGAFQIAEQIATPLNAPLFKNEVTRLLVEPNRSVGSPSLFSEYSYASSKKEHEEILKHYYFPYRLSVENQVKKFSNVLHLSVHTFTPVLNGIVRNVDIGLLFDPARKHEVKICEAIRDAMEKTSPFLRVAFNEPYKGIDDGFTTHLRTLFPDRAYMGIEIEVNQKLVEENQLGLVSEALINAVSGCVG
jgi:predicted N-formylglutamate amidohydrolase